MTRATLGIDLGTSGVRAVVLSQEGQGQVLANAAARIDPAGRRDPARLWAAVAGMLDGMELGSVEAVAVDGTSGTLLAVAVDGTPVSRLSMYDDKAGTTERAAVAAVTPADSPASALARAIGLCQPGVARVLHEADWVAGQLSGRFDVSDENNALKTGYDPVARRWPGWVVAAGMPRRTLPEVVPAGSRLGPVTDGAARRFGFPTGCVVAAGTTDGCASFLATGADRAGDAVTALGSTMTLKLLATSPVTCGDSGVYSHRLGDLWLAGGASNAGGAALGRWFEPEEIAALSARIDPRVASPLDYYPLPCPGERFPVHDPALQPRLLPRPADDAAFLHGLLEGIARIEALGYRRLAELGAPPVRRVLTTGGGARNATWTAIRERVLGAPVSAACAEAGHAAALGAALLARRALESSGPVLGEGGPGA